MLLLLPSATTIVLLLSWTCSHSIVLQGVRGGRVGLDAHISSRRTRGRQEQQRGHSTELKVGISSSYTAAEKEDLEIEVMMNGLPGKMGFDVAAACMRKGLKLSPIALTGHNMPDSVEVEGQKVKLLAPDTVETASAIIERRNICVREGRMFVAIDYTHPSAVNNNARLYSQLTLPFVMGTTGGDRDALVAEVENNSKLYAVIAPNMGKQIVALQTSIEFMAKEFPGSFDGYSLSVVESHQAAKSDTSGTCLALTHNLASLTGAPFDENSIVKLRKADEQLVFGVPKSALNGHAYHTYTLKSDNGLVEFEFKHNVCGRDIYADGTADAVKFLAKQIVKKADKRLYSMIDVLRMGGM